MSATTRISETEYLALATAGGNDQWELFDGEARRKPGMSAAHNALMAELAFMLRSQLDPARFRVGVNSARIRWTERNFFIPDIVVIPASAVLERIALPDLERYDAPMPLIVEIWSPSTGEYDLDVKLAAYQARGDAEIWRIHPGERQIERWILRDDGTWQSSRVYLGSIVPAALPDVSIDLAALFSILG